MNTLLLLKSLHIVGFVAWFAGMFYLVRMFVYHVESNAKSEPDRSVLRAQFNLMQWRVYKIIMNPAMMITWTAGIIILVLGVTQDTVPNYLSSDVGTPGWMHAKLLLLVLLTVYHVICKRTIKKLESDTMKMDSFQLRLFNEVPTLFLVAIVFLAVLGKAGTLNYLYWALGLLVFSGLMYMGARAYKKRREQAGA